MDGGLSVQGDGMMDRNHNLFLGIEPNNPVENRIVIRSYNVFSPHDILHCKRLLLSVTSFCRKNAHWVVLKLFFLVIWLFCFAIATQWLQWLHQRHLWDEPLSSDSHEKTRSVNTWRARQWRIEKKTAKAFFLVHFWPTALNLRRFICWHSGSLNGDTSSMESWLFTACTAL